MQVYKGLNIGTSKITDDDMQGIPHYMLDIKEPNESFSVAEFKERVVRYINEIHQRNNIPFIVGGTGLYIQAVLYDYNFSERKRDEQITKRLEAMLKRDGNEKLYERLQRIDPEQAKRIHPNNYRRVIRALEVYESTGLTMSQYHEQQQREVRYDHLLIGLHMKRSLLYEKINRRVDEMIGEGLIEEVTALYERGYEHEQAMKAIGYKELLPYIKGEQTLDKTIQLLKRNTRRYAKRQLTWFRKQMDVEWFDVTVYDKHVYDDIKQRIITFLNS